jgi:selenocysteine lyase/cysteine desulfurase
MTDATSDDFSPDEIRRLREDTPGCHDRLHFNNAGAGLMPAPVLRAAVSHLELEARIGGYEAADAAEEAADAFYRHTALLLNAKPETIAYTASATDSYVRALSSVPLRSGDTILTTRNDYISNQINFLSLEKRFGVEVVHAPDSAQGGVDVDALEELVRRNRPALVAVTHIPTNGGLVQPVEAIGEICRAHEVLYLVDACQSVGQRVVDVERIGCNFLSATSRKFLRGPRGSGFLYVSSDTLAGGYEPLFIDMRGARWSAERAYQPAATARRFEEWETAYALQLAASEANRYAHAVGLERTQRRVTRLARRLRDALAERPNLRLVDKGSELGALVMVEVAGWDPEPLKLALDERRVNSALSLREFAQFDFGEKNVEWCIRLSPHYYNTDDEVDQVASIVGELASRGPASTGS